MCGIAGAMWTRPEAALAPETLRRMVEALRPRGPDDEGYFESAFQVRAPYDARPGVALGHRRLAIIDPTGGHQPLSNEDGSVQVILNGEIYNYAALRRRLEGAGHIFRTASDSETLVHLYEDEGLNCFSHLNGMFAAAIWDQERGRLILARDRLGKKPLVYHHAAGRVCFASELKSLLQVPGLPQEIDHSAVDAYFMYQYIPQPRTIYQNILKLPPAHYAVFERGHCELQSYWQPELQVEQSISYSEAVEQLRSLLTDAVKLRLRSDVPLGAFLSGGVDSSIVAAIAQREMSHPLQTFTIGFAEAEYDERPYARKVAQHLGCDHHEELITPQAIELLPKLVAAFDEPFADSSAIPTWYLAEITKRQVTVALSGDGGDELFLGYARYKAVQWASVVDRFPSLRSLLSAKCWQKLPHSSRQSSRWRQFQRFSEALRMSPARRYANWISIFNETLRGELYSREFVEQLSSEDPVDHLQSAWNRGGNRTAISNAAVADIFTYLPGDLLTKVDICGMAQALEARQPLLDYRLVEFAATLPNQYHYRRGCGKQLLQAACGDLLPREVFARKKQGFGVPLAAWFRGPLRAHIEQLTSATSELSRSGWFQGTTLQSFVNEHLANRFDHSARLWSLIVLEEWLREYHEARK